MDMDKTPRLSFVPEEAEPRPRSRSAKGPGKVIDPWIALHGSSGMAGGLHGDEKPLFSTYTLHSTPIVLSKLT